MDNLRSIVTRSLKDVTAPGLSADGRFIMAYDAARTLSLMIVRSAGYRPRAVGSHYNTFVALEAADPPSLGWRQPKPPTAGVVFAAMGAKERTAR